LEQGNTVPDASPTVGFEFHGRALRRARRGDHGRPALLAWLAGLAIHFVVVLLLVV
jgi:hypothetical protein